MLWTKKLEVQFVPYIVQQVHIVHEYKNYSAFSTDSGDAVYGIIAPIE